MYIIRILVVFVLLLTISYANANKKSIAATKTTTPPTIDGVIDEAVWERVASGTGFYRFQPESGGHAPVKTEIKMLYDDVTLYVAATMYDPEPSLIPAQLGKRDDDNVRADWLGLWMSPFNDGSNELNFAVTIAGAQIDRKFSPENVDDNWNPVWTSEVSIHELGWSVEMAIPFSQIRFPAKDIQTWGVNMARYRARERETYTWVSLDKSQENFAQQAGLLLGIANIETPLRLSFTPYVATSIEHYPHNVEGKRNYSTSYRGGMDLKYGINESFTLDMTLIPDYGQVQSDNQELNLTPFEIRYNEHRPFFTEGTQLLQKAGLFYSRRVGSTPVSYWDVSDGVVLEEGEEVISNPDETQLINATKVTGQTVNGIGLGFFNAITAATYATIGDSLGAERDYLTNPLTNYNLVVIGKNLKNGSDISIANTNVQRFVGDDTTNNFRDANVIGFETRLVTADSKWVLEASGAYDELSYPDSISTGHRYWVGLSEGLGAFQYGLGHGAESEFFNPNDMGFLRQPNEFSQNAWISLQTINPVWKLNNGSVRLRANYSSQFKPREYSNFNINANYNATFRNYISIGGGFNIRPIETYDFNEPRVDGRYFTYPVGSSSHVWLASNGSRAFSLSGWTGISTINRRSSQWQGGGFEPRWRVNNRWLMSFEFDMHVNDNDHGFADFNSSDEPIFGQRDQLTVTNSFYTSYIFSRDLESEIRMRYYRSSVDYDGFYDLMDDGELRLNQVQTDLWDTGDDNLLEYNSTYDEVFGVFTLDAVLTWRFSPGSEMNVTWKNVILSDSENPGEGYFDDLKDLTSLKQSNSISFKLLYYVDTWNLKRRL